jgi:hypothetical protein
MKNMVMILSFYNAKKNSENMLHYFLRKDRTL